MEGQIPGLSLVKLKKLRQLSQNAQLSGEGTIRRNSAYREAL